MKRIRFFFITILTLILNTTAAGEIRFDNGPIPGEKLLSSIQEMTGEKPYVAFKADFDNDSVKELVIGILCGNAGCVNLVFRKIQNQMFEYITHISFHKKAFQLVPNPNSKFSDIYHYWRSNASTGCLILLKYEKDRYQEASKECGSSELFYKIETEAIVDAEL